MSDLSERIANLPPHRRAQIEQALLARSSTAAQRSLPLIPVAQSIEEMPPALSFAQKRLWFLDQLEPHSHLNTVAAAWQIRGPLDLGALRQALQTIVARHDALRTTIDIVDGEPIPVTALHATLDVPLVDASAWPDREREARVTALLDEARWHHFDLSHDLPLHVTVVRLQPDEHLVLWTWHHIASDAWSAAVFERELSVLYAAYVAGKPSPLPALPIQYADFARWERQRLQGSYLESLLSYWRKQLQGSTLVLDLATDYPRPRLQTYRGAEQMAVLPEQLSSALVRLARQEGATLFMVVLTAFNVLLYRHSRQTDIIVGTPIAGRSLPETEALIGLFLNTLALRTDLSGDPTFRELLTRVRRTALDAYAHQDLPFQRLVQELPVKRDLNRAPVLQVLFNLRSAARPPLEMAGLVLTPVELESRVAHYDLTLTMMERAEGLRLQLEYDTALFERSTIARMVSFFRALLAAFIADPTQHISALLDQA